VRGVYPGSFNPPTVAHLAIARAAVAQLGLARLDLSVSRVALGKEDLSVPTLADRLAVLREVVDGEAGLRVRVTDARLLADVAAGYDVLVVGADKWAQVLDPGWYGAPGALDAALTRLPRVAVAPRTGTPLAAPPPGVQLVVLDLDAAHADVSATLARGGRSDLMLPAAAHFDATTGAWSDPDRYRRLRGLAAR